MSEIHAEAFYYAPPRAPDKPPVAITVKGGAGPISVEMGFDLSVEAAKDLRADLDDVLAVAMSEVNAGEER